MTDSSFCTDSHPQLALAEHSLSTPTAFPDLYGRQKRFVDRSANKYHRQNRRLDVEDLKQLGYIALWKAHKSFKSDKGIPIEHYARRAVVNEMIKACQRDHSPHEVLHDNLPVGDGKSVGSDIVALIDHIHYDRVVKYEIDAKDPIFEVCAGLEVSAILFESGVPLTKMQRQVLDLLFREGLNVQEAADILGVSRQYVSKQQNKALEVCRRFLRVNMH